MKKWVIFTLLLLFLAACSQVSEPNQEAKDEVSDETASAAAVSYPVYLVQDNGVRPEQIKSLLAQFGAESSVATDASRAVSFVDTKRFMVIPSQVKERGQSREGEGEVVLETFDFDAFKALQPVSEERALESVQAALKANGLFPSDVLPLITAQARAAFSNAEVVDAKGNVLVQAKLDTHVFFDFKLNLTAPIPLLGPGAKVKAVLNPEGRVTQLYYGLHGLKEIRSVQILPRTRALSACTKAFAGANSNLQPSNVAAQLVYYVPEARDLLGKLEVSPSYACTGTAVLGKSNVTLRKIMINASTGKPLYTGSLGQDRSTPALTTQSIPRVDVGAEYVGVSQGLGGSQDNANGFVTTMTASSIPVQFHWGDYAAWERDFKDPSFSGDDTNWVDDVDMTFYTGHANGNGFTFPSSFDDGFLNYNDALWGDSDLEWLVIAACGPLQLEEGGLRWWQRWGPAFQGLHQLLGYTTVSWDNTVEGQLMAQKILGTSGEAPRTIRQAWVETATQAQADNNVIWAYMVPFGSDGSSNLDDYFWGKGTTTFDIALPSGFIHVSGPS
ncbi:MAG: DUF6345 domain-containing protein [Trueperaceae bacterium]